MLFIPQAYRLFKKKDSKELSLLTFGGFNFIQLFIMLYGIIHQDTLLIVGYSLSFMTCGSVTVLTIFYRLRQKASQKAIDKETQNKA